MGHLGSFLVVFEHFRVRGIWVSLIGFLNCKSRALPAFPPQFGLDRPFLFGNGIFIDPPELVMIFPAVPRVFPIRNSKP